MGINYFGCTVKYDKVGEDGVAKTVTEQYIVNALNVTEANAIVLEQLTPYISGEFDVDGIKKMKLADVMESDNSLSDTWYMVKVGETFLDEKTGEEKMNTSRCLVCAESLEDAISRFKKAIEGTMADWKFIAVQETKYMDYFKPQVKE